MKSMEFLFEPMNALVTKYCAIAFEKWNVGTQFHDYADVDEDSEEWWQAHTDVLEIDQDEDGKRYALVSITIYPSAVHSSPPAPSAEIKIYQDGRVMRGYADRDNFEWRQHAS